MLQRVGLPYHLSRRHAARSVLQRRDGHERVVVGRGRGRACTWGSLAAVSQCGPASAPRNTRYTPSRRHRQCRSVACCVSACQCCCVCVCVSLSVVVAMSPYLVVSILCFSLRSRNTPTMRARNNALNNVFTITYSNHFFYQYL